MRWPLKWCILLETQTIRILCATFVNIGSSFLKSERIKLIRIGSGTTCVIFAILMKVHTLCPQKPVNFIFALSLLTDFFFLNSLFQSLTWWANISARNLSPQFNRVATLRDNKLCIKYQHYLCYTVTVKYGRIWASQSHGTRYCEQVHMMCLK